MAENLSLADRAVAALAAVSAMCDGCVGLDRPERHAVRDLKREAEAVLREAFIRAEGLAYMAKGLTDLVATVRQEEAERHANSNQDTALHDAVEQILTAGHMDQEDLARLRAAYLPA